MPTSLLNQGTSNSDPSSLQQVPVQLISILTKINENISEVKERVIRLEAQDYQHTLRDLRVRLEEEAEKRRTLEDKLNELKGRVAPILMGLTMVGTIAVNYAIRLIHI